ncbi:tetratricopeptide repeat protein [bacterium]|nr:tetratricopeptide repeat protein [bacterium]
MSKTDKLIRWGLWLVLIFLPWHNGGKEILSFSFVQVFIFFLFILWLKQFYFSKEINIKKTVLDFPLLLLLLTVIVSTFFSFYLHNSLLGLFKIITYFLIYYLFINTTSLKSVKFFNIFYQSIIIVSLLLSFVGIYQYFTGQIVKATFPNPNFLAGYLVVGIAIGMSNLFLKQRHFLFSNDLSFKSFDEYKKERSKSEKLKGSWVVYSLIAISLMFICLILTHSRGGVFSLFVVCLFVFGIRFKIWGIISVLIAGLVLFIIFPEASLIRLFKMGNIDPYVYQRPNIWKSAIAIIKDNFFLGVGVENFELGFYQHNFPVIGVLARYGKYARFAHNEIVQIVAEIGVGALIIFLWIVNLFFREGIKLLNKTDFKLNKKDNINEKYIIAALCGIIAILSHSLVDFNLHLPAIMLLLILFVSTIINFSSDSFYRFSYKKNIFMFTQSVIFCLMFFIIMVFLGECCAQKKKWEKAIFFNPLNADYYKKLGDSFLSKYNKKKVPEKYLQAEILRAYKKMVVLSPHDPYYRDRLGRFFYEISSKNFLINALSEYKKAIFLNPTEPFFRFHLASLYFNEGHYERALSIWQEAVDIEPNFIEAHYWLGIAFLNLDKDKEAEEEFLKILELKKRVETLHNFGSNYEKALIKFDYALVYNTMGYQYFKRGDLKEAFSFYEEALKINPDFAPTYSNIGGIYFSQKMYKKAKSMVEKALEFNPGNKMYKNNLKKINEKCKGQKNK